VNYDNIPEIKAMLGKDSLLPLKQYIHLLETKQNALLSALGIYIGNGSNFVGNEIYLGPYTRINSISVHAETTPIIIRGHCTMGNDIRIIGVNHDINTPAFQVPDDSPKGLQVFWRSKGSIEIGYNVWIGERAFIMPGVKIGDGAVIGGGAIVTKDVPPYGIAVGSPARTVKKRFTEHIISQLQEIRWWDWTKEKMIRNSFFFSLDLTKIPDLDLHKVILA
jgi:virginiamycin A acetyltransferase